MAGTCIIAIDAGTRRKLIELGVEVVEEGLGAEAGLGAALVGLVDDVAVLVAQYPRCFRVLRVLVGKDLAPIHGGQRVAIEQCDVAADAGLLEELAHGSSIVANFCEA
ncbi:MAG: hypothetical protein ACPGSH_04120, partial [Ilumatobacteraceae bacterium]